MDNKEFEEFLAAVRGGDHRAAAELVKRYEPALRRVIHLRLRDPRLRRILDTTDVCQSILADFLARSAGAGFEFRTPEELRRLLVTMVLNKIRSRARKERRHGGTLPEGAEFISPAASPQQAVADQDLARAIRERLSEEELWLVEQRMDGRSWEELAAERGSTAAALRMQRARAVARVRQALEQEE